MKASLLWVVLLTACGAEESASRALHRFTPTTEDEARLAQGMLPVLILQDGAPRPGALFRIEPWPFGAPVLEETGQRELVLSEDDPAVLRADDRGIVWYVPPQEYYWHRRASADGRVWSQPFLCWQADEVRAAARVGILDSVAELCGTSEWRIEITTSGGLAAERVPVFLIHERGVFLHASPVAESTFRSHDYWAMYAKEIEKVSFALVAGFDFERAIPVEQARDGARFDLSDCGSIEVALVDESGAPLRSPRAVFLEPADSERATGWGDRRRAAHGSPSVVAAEGTAILAGVPPGGRWRVGAFLLPGTAIVSMECAGPSRAGEVQRVVLSAREESVTIRARLQDEHGMPASGAIGELRATGGAHLPFRADADGSLTVRAPRAWLAASEEFQLLEDYDASRIGHSATIAAAPLREEGVEHVWVWSEQSDALLAQGRVVDEFGAGVPFANVYVWDAGASGRTDARGYFRIELDDDPADVNLITVDSAWHVETEQAIVKGSRGLEVQVRRGARIAGTIAAPHRQRNLTLSYLRPGAEESVSLWASDWWSGEGEFEIGPIPVDAIEVRLDFKKAGVVVLRDLPLVAGEVHQLTEPLRPEIRSQAPVVGPSGR